MVEGTGGIDFILPVILAIVLSNWVASYIHSPGAYESDLERLGKFLGTILSQDTKIYLLPLPTISTLFLLRICSSKTFRFDNIVPRPQTYL
jgi:hypothetical protein